MEDYETEENNESVRVLLLGEQETDGLRLVNNYRQYYSDLISNKLKREGSKEEIKFFLLDSAKKLILYNPSIFFHKAKVIIFVYDITNKKSFKSIKSFWYPLAKTFWENDPILAVVGHKQELYLEAKVREDDGENYAKSIGAFFQEVSSLDGSGLYSLFTKIGDAYLSKKSREEKEEQYGNYGFGSYCSCFWLN